METIGGILGQIIATTNVLVLLAAYTFVYFLRFQVKRKKVRQFQAERRRQMYLKVFGQQPESYFLKKKESTSSSGAQRESPIKD